MSALPPISATPPSSAVTRNTASRRVISSGVSRRIPLSLSVILTIPRSEIATIELLHREVSSTGGERHVSKRRILTRGRRHARAIGDEHVGRVPHLVVRVEHRRLGVASHTCRAHLVDAHAGEVPRVIDLHILHAASVEQLRHVHLHVATHGVLVLASGAVDRDHRHAPLVLLAVVDRDLVVVIWQHLADSGAADVPSARHRHRVLDGTSDAQLGYRPSPIVPTSTALVAEAAQIRTLVAKKVSVTRDIESVWTAAKIILVIQSLALALSTSAEVMVHQVMPELTGAAAESARPYIRRRAHQQPCRVER